MDRKLRSRKLLLDIANSALLELKADKLLKSALQNIIEQDNYFLVAIGKAAWQMAYTAHEFFGKKIIDGIVITKYQHSQGKIGELEIYEAGHPIVDKNSLTATERTIELVQNLSENDHVLFLVSGGGSALFEVPASGIRLKDLQIINQTLINSGASIKEINDVRKHLSRVKGGRFAEIVFPAEIESFILSDVISDDLNVIASGPATADPTTSKNALKVLKKYNIDITKEMKTAILTETPKQISNSYNTIIGYNKDLCNAVLRTAKENDLDAELIEFNLELEVSEFAALIKEKIIHYKRLEHSNPKLLIFGGEPVVKVTGKNPGGRNQHLALLMAKIISKIDNIVFLSLASDGTDGPTDAAGGIVDNNSWQKMKDLGLNPTKALQDFDSYNCLKKSENLIKTGPTGTNVNDIFLALIY